MADDPMEHKTKSFGGGWNYRVMRFAQRDGRGDWFEVREVFYDSDGKPSYYSDSEHGASGETVEELRDEHAMIAQAFERPTLTDADFPSDTSWLDDVERIASDQSRTVEGQEADR